MTGVDIQSLYCYTSLIDKGNAHSFPPLTSYERGVHMSTTKYIRDAQLSIIKGAELYRRRFYLSKQALDAIDLEAEKLGLSPSEYVASLALHAVHKLAD